MAEKTDTNRFLIRRKPKVRPDGSGRAVWAEPIEDIEFELLSTAALKKILKSDDSQSRASLEHAAQGSDDGILARDTSNGQFEIIDDDELQAILDDVQKVTSARQPAAASSADSILVPLTDDAEQSVDELCLVSTQALRKILVNDDTEDTKDEFDDAGGGFDPYDTAR